MKTLWFDEGVDRRDTGPKSRFCKKPLRLQLAIILAANKNKVDAWELVKPECQAVHLAEADRLLAEGVSINRQGGQERDLRRAAA
jgi:hypothetical protein